MRGTRSTEQANSAIKVAALVVAAVYLYRRFTEGTAEELKASQKVTPLGRWVIGWSVVFFGLSVAAGPFPGAAGDLAILLALGSVLSNGLEISKDLNAALGKPPAKTTKGRPRSGTVTTTANENEVRPLLEVRSA